MYNKIKELPTDERPYEKFIKYGPQALSDAELIAIFIKSGTKDKSCIELARDVLRLPDGRYSILAICKKDFDNLTNINGIGTVKALCLKCIAEISKRISTASYDNLVKFTSPKDIAEYYMERFRHLKYEEFCVVFLDSSNNLILERILTKGTTDQSLVSVRDVFSNALEVSASRVVLLHNHPSGNPTPSKDDISTTNALCDAGKLLDILVLDHIIIGDRKYMSFRECGLISETD